MKLLCCCHPLSVSVKLCCYIYLGISSALQDMLSVCLTLHKSASTIQFDCQFCNQFIAAYAAKRHFCQAQQSGPGFTSDQPIQPVQCELSTVSLFLFVSLTISFHIHPLSSIPLHFKVHFALVCDKLAFVDENLHVHVIRFDFVCECQFHCDRHSNTVVNISVSKLKTT